MKGKGYGMVMAGALGLLMSSQVASANVYKSDLYGFVVESANDEVGEIIPAFLIKRDGEYLAISSDKGLGQESNSEVYFGWYGEDEFEIYECIELEEYFDGINLTCWKIVNPSDEFIGAAIGGVERGEELIAVSLEQVADNVVYTNELKVRADELLNTDTFMQLKLDGWDADDIDYYPVMIMDNNSHCVAIASSAYDIWTTDAEWDDFYAKSHAPIFPEANYEDMGNYTAKSGAKFWGALDEDGNQVGYGMVEYTDGDVYRGMFENGYRNGFGVYYFADEDFQIGYSVDGDIRGIGCYIYSDGSVFLGEHDNGTRNGDGILLDFASEGDKYVTLGTWKEGRLISEEAEEIWEDESGLYAGAKENGKPEGYCVRVNEDGEEIFVGFFEDGEEQGYGVLINDDMIRYGYWMGGYTNGWFVQTEDGESMMGYCDEDNEDFIGEIAFFSEENMTIGEYLNEEMEYIGSVSLK